MILIISSLLTQTGIGCTLVGEGLVIHNVPVKNIELVKGHCFLQKGRTKGGAKGRAKGGAKGGPREGPREGLKGGAKGGAKGRGQGRG